MSEITATQAPVPTKRVRKPRKDKGVKRGTKVTTKAKTAKTKTQAPTKAIKLEPNLDNYTRDTSVKTASGAPSIDVNDSVAQSLRGRDLGAVYEIAAKKVGESVAALRKRYGHLNPGMQRMNLGNRIRGSR
mgnify:CR=1 FL=1